MSNVTFNTVQSMTLDYCADTVEWCPLSPYQLYFVCGTYHLKQVDDAATFELPAAGRIRTGQLLLYEVTSDGRIEQRQCIKSNAIFDTKWCKHYINDEYVLLAVAEAVGIIHLWNLTTDEETQTVLLKHVTTCSLAKNSADVMALSVDWSPVVNIELRSPTICVTDSLGMVHLLTLDGDNTLQERKSWKASLYELWVATFNCDDPHIVYTGGDDSTLRVFDYRLPTEQALLISGEHKSGVTSLRSHHLDTHILASGSYDETIKIWDNRSMKQSLTTEKFNGGIWRIKWHPYFDNEMLVAGMYDGFYYVSWDKASGKLNQTGHHPVDRKLAYGVDFCYLASTDIIKNITSFEKYGNGRSNLSLAVTCTFYDKNLSLFVIN